MVKKIGQKVTKVAKLAKSRNAKWQKVANRATYSPGWPEWPRPGQNVQWATPNFGEKTVLNGPLQLKIPVPIMKYDLLT